METANSEEKLLQEDLNTLYEYLHQTLKDEDPNKSIALGIINKVLWHLEANSIAKKW